MPTTAFDRKLEEFERRIEDRITTSQKVGMATVLSRAAAVIFPIIAVWFLNETTSALRTQASETKNLTAAVVAVDKKLAEMDGDRNLIRLQMNWNTDRIKTLEDLSKKRSEIEVNRLNKADAQGNDITTR